MWDLLDNVVTYLASSDRLQHGGAGSAGIPTASWPGKPWNYYCLDRTWQFKFSTKGYVVWLC
ncbi:hypothetical protein DIPPA_31312 [Diplonema papillatum]|nr:hypothetical protein DIPPA_31312 [Diplonema papillatum]